MDTDINVTLLSLYIHDNLHNNSSIALIAYVSNVIQIGFLFKALFNRFLDLFCKVCPTGLV